MFSIVLVDENWGIGCEGAQNIFIKGDLKRFRQLTQGATVILGRKTLATFPQGKPLPNRRNLVLSRDSGFTVEGAEVFPSVEAILKEVEAEDSPVFVIGGASVYERFLPYCQKVYVTKVQKTLPADTYFTDLDENPDWRLVEESAVEEEDSVAYSYCLYEQA